MDQELSMMRDRIVKRLSDQGWIVSAFFRDEQNSTQYRIVWTEHGIERMRRLHEILTELKIFNGSQSAYIVGDLEVIAELAGYCIREHGVSS